MARICIISASKEGQAAKIADRIGLHLTQLGHAVIRRAATDTDSIDLDTIDGLIAGGSIHVGKHDPTLASFVQRHRAQLETKPTAFFSVSLSAAGSEIRQQADAKRLLNEFLTSTGWRPDLTATFAGALRYTQYGFVKRWLLKRIAGKEGGDTDTARDHEYTDWASVEAFARAFAAMTQAPNQPSSSEGSA